ncbi:MAG: Holliday junction branch migration DNA helicase RuvB [Candidatus Gracilibacteria bacterium]|nr:Holliday junction branch migration DNA helicase RuvB [Candidatus Gracilibacteria bacterium]
MAIKSVKKDKGDRIIQATEKVEDIVSENTLRPRILGDYVGQEAIKKHLQVSISAARIRGESLEHIVFYGPPGLGKTTLSNIVASEMGVNLKISSGPAIEKQSDLVSILSNLQDNDILFIDEIHRLKPQIEEVLYTAMEDFTIDIMVGKGTGASSVRIAIPPFTLIGATTKFSSLSAPLRDRFGNVLKLDFYSREDILSIIKRNSSLLGIDLTDETFKKIASRSRGTPRIANRLLKIVRDYVTIGHDINDSKEFDEIFRGLHIDSLGLDALDKKVIETIYSKFSGGPVGLNTLASSVGEDEDTIENVVEPYLLQIGFLERTPKGRKLTDIAIKHLF